MKGYLLDTHVVLWWLAAPERLPPALQEVIRKLPRSLFVSVAAIWEMAIKRAMGRLEMPSNLLQVLNRQQIQVLPIQADHALAVANLPLLHHDPFDRIQIAQAAHEDLALVTADRWIQKYDVQLWSI